MVGLGAIGLAIALPNAYAFINNTIGTFDFATCDGTVCGVAGEAEKAGIRVGDRVNARALPLDDRYTDATYNWYPPPGRRISFPLARGDEKYTVTLAARPDHREPSGLNLLSILWVKPAQILITVLVSALFFIRPTPLSGSLALCSLGSLAVTPLFYNFLPALAYAGITILSLGVFFAASVAGFLGLALVLGRSWRRSYRLLLTILFALFAIPLTALPIFSLLGLPTLALFSIVWLGITFVLIVGAVILIATALRRTVPAGERLAAVLLAVSGLAAAFNFIYAVASDLEPRWVPAALFGMSTMQSGLNSAQVTASVTRWIALAAAAYVIVRERVVDIGLVRSRILAYGGTVVAVLAAFGFVNWAFAAALARFPFAIPLEIFAALAIGYWFSGFRDVSSALSLAAVDAPSAAINGRRADEHDALARALGLAERTRQASLIAEIRARCAFSAWVNGDDPAFEEHINASQQALGSQTLRGIKKFVLAATSEESTVAPDPNDLPEWLARASLLRCARSGDARRAGDHALDAVRHADANGEPWLRVLGRVALVESVSSQRAQRLNEADAIARASGSLLLAKSLAALRAGKRDLGMLQAFVEIRMRKKRLACPAVEIAFFTGEVRLLGAALELPDKERELLFTLAASNGLMNGDLLCDALWPESDGDAARNAFHVCLHRLRKRVGDPRIVQCLDQGYALHPGADVDLWRLEAAFTAARSDEIETLSELARTGAGRRASLGRWFAPFENRLARTLEKIERLFEVKRARNGIQRSEPSVSFPLSSG